LSSGKPEESLIRFNATLTFAFPRGIADKNNHTRCARLRVYASNTTEANNSLILHCMWTQRLTNYMNVSLK